MFEKILKRSSWTDIVVSIIFVIFGILLILKPNEIISGISMFLGIIFIAMGILKLIEYFTTDIKEDFLLTVALISVISGVIIMFCSETILSLFRIILGLWIIVTGIINFQTTLVWKERKSIYWTITLIFSMAIMFAGMIILINQNIIFTTIGIIIIISAVLDIIDRIIFMNKIDNYIKG